jgi:Cytochrome oxidase complex assembly protein 1
MPAKKLIIIIASIAVVLALLVAVSVAAIIALTRYSMGQSEAAAAAQTFLRNNEKLMQDIGEVRAFGSMVTSSVNTHNADGEATLILKVIGARQTVKATVELIYRQGKNWRVTGASYTNQAGNTIELFNPYESKLKVQIANPKAQISTLELKIQNSKFQISNFKFQRTDFRSPISRSEIAESCPESVVLV